MEREYDEYGVDKGNKPDYFIHGIIVLVVIIVSCIIHFN